jgi:hypothetical protein
MEMLRRLSNMENTKVDWDLAPADAEEGVVINGGNARWYRWYKGIKCGSYSFYDTINWVEETGTPLHDNRTKRPTSPRSNVFTKDMLIAGTHLVETTGGVLYAIFNSNDGDIFMFCPEAASEWMTLSDYNNNMTCQVGDKYTINKVYTTRGCNFYDRTRLKLIWERDTTTDLELQSIKADMAKLQEKINNLEDK